MTVFRGKKNSPDIGKVIAFDGEPEMDVWDGDECNQFVGTDSTIFAPYMDVKDGIWAYEAAVCRSLGADYVGKSKYKGVVRTAGKPRCKCNFSQIFNMTHSILSFSLQPTAEFAIDIGSEQNALPCFCRDYPDECPAKGNFFN